MAPTGHRRNLLFSSSHPRRPRRSPGRTYKIGRTNTAVFGIIYGFIWWPSLAV